ncbi:MAG TPA: hypothetical protein VFQ61_04265 [Polyangiaceae bacterium]|nr:hypothetical protein [Polyangiaceae bacterium]
MQGRAWTKIGGCTAVAGLGSILVLSPARAVQPLRLEVARSLQAADCPDSVDLERRISQVLGRPLAETRDAAETLRVSVDFDRRRGAFFAVLRFDGSKRGERNLRDPSASCAALADAVTATLALVLDRVIERGEREPPLEPSSVSNQPNAGRKAVKSDNTAGEQPRVPWGLALAAGAGVGVGFVPELGWMIGGGLQARGPLGLELGLSIQRMFAPELSLAQGRVETSLTFGRVQICRFVGSTVRWAPCVQYGFGALRGAGHDYSENRSTSLFWSALGPGLLGRLSLTRAIFVQVRAEAWIPLRRLSLTVENGGRPLQTPGIAGDLGLEFGVDWAL